MRPVKKFNKKKYQLNAKAQLQLRQKTQSPQKNLYSSFLPHYFKRMLDDATIYTSGAMVVSAVTAAFAAPPWITLGPLLADQGGVANTAQFGFSVTPYLNALPGASEFISLFERYEILKLECKITPLMGDSYANGNGQVPTLYSVLDYTDGAALTSQAQTDQYENCQEFQLAASGGKPFFRSCVPKPSMQMFVSAVATGYGTPAAPRWLDTVVPSSNIPHYGMKFYIRNWIASAANLGNAIRVQPTLYFRLREAR